MPSTQCTLGFPCRSPIQAPLKKNNIKIATALIPATIGLMILIVLPFSVISVYA